MSIDALQKKVFGYFEGDWSVKRRFEGSYTAVFDGLARFKAESDAGVAYRYEEAGELNDGAGKQFNARQVYLYRLKASTIEVHKRDESDWTLMHELPFQMDGEDATSAHVHLCGKDYYSAVYRVNFMGGWVLRYAVTGPTKDYTIHSVYSRSS
ncbi:MAG: DUF6314 family protein [Opitutales bacterium]